MKAMLSDWQFWVVTIAAVAALLYMVRGALPPGVFGKKAKGKAATLTVLGKPVGKKKSSQ
ncbi:MAG: hypothetical protein ACOYN0_15770 [Phycisphaerales bacterium]